MFSWTSGSQSFSGCCLFLCQATFVIHTPTQHFFSQSVMVHLTIPFFCLLILAGILPLSLSGGSIVTFRTHWFKVKDFPVSDFTSKLNHNLIYLRVILSHWCVQKFFIQDICKFCNDFYKDNHQYQSTLSCALFFWYFYCLFSVVASRFLFLSFYVALQSNMMLRVWCKHFVQQKVFFSIWWDIIGGQAKTVPGRLLFGFHVGYKGLMLEERWLF